MRLVAGVLLGIAVNFIWGLAFLIPHLMSTTDPVLITAGRYAVYGLLSVPLLLSSSRASIRGLERQDWLWAMAFAFAGNVGYYAFLVTSIRLGGISVAALIVGTLPVTLAVYGNYRQRELSRRRLALPLFLISAGLIAVNGGKLAAASTSTETRALVLGASLAVVALGMWTWYGVQNARYLKMKQQNQADEVPRLGDADWSAVVGVCTLALTFLALPLLVVIGVWSPGSALRVLESHRAMSSILIASLVLGVLVSWFATVIWNRVSRILPVSLAGQLVVFETLSSLLYAAIADRKVPPTYELGAMSIIVLGVVLAVRATSAVEVMERRGEESSGSAEALAMVES